MPQPAPFYQGYKQPENGLRFKDWIEAFVRLSDAGYSYPARDSAPQGKREPLESHQRFTTGLAGLCASVLSF